jgi:alkylhydroperoxidase family enzyme
MSITCHSVGRLLTPAGESAAALEALWEAIWRSDRIPPALLEYCRLVLAKVNRAEAELTVSHPAAGADSLKAACVLDGDPMTDPRFTPAERAALEFAEAYGLDAASITDEQADAVKRHWGEPGLVFLIEALGMIDSRMRLALMMPVLLPQSTH